MSLLKSNDFAPKSCGAGFQPAPPSERWFYCEGGRKMYALNALNGDENQETQQAKEVTMKFVSGTSYALNALNESGKNNEMQLAKGLAV